MAAGGAYYWNGQAIDDAELATRLQTEGARDPQPDLHIRGDREVRYSAWPRPWPLPSARVCARLVS